MNGESGNGAQIEYWNSAAGNTWARFQPQLDRQIAPLGREAMRVLAPAAGEQVLDIGCGCGDTSIELAARVGPTGRVLGVDISVPMLSIARSRAAPQSGVRPEFRQADAQSEDLGSRQFDAVYSRFGVMFFSDPVAAFKNILGSLKARGRLAFVCWRPLDLNPWMKDTFEAALPFLPPVPPSDAQAPGPFAFADAGRVRGILQSAGFDGVRVEPFSAAIGDDLVEEMLKLTLRVGPLGFALRRNPELKTLVEAPVRAVLERHAPTGRVLMDSAVWIVSAGAP